MQIKNVVPWRVRNRMDIWLEQTLRPRYHRLYKLIRFGRPNLNTASYWDNIWRNDTENRDYSELFAQILKQVDAGTKVLDVGCGSGRLSRALRDQRAAQVTALDFSPWACQQLAAEGFDTVVSALPAIPLPDRSYDVAVATEVLEHLDRPLATLREMVRVVRPGGLVMCSVPNDTLHPHEELEHQQAFTEERLRDMFRSLGLSIETKTGRLIADADFSFLLAIAHVD